MEPNGDPAGQPHGCHRLVFEAPRVEDHEIARAAESVEYERDGPSIVLVDRTGTRHDRALARQAIWSEVVHE